MSTLTKDFILKVPKTDLHVHLDGSIRPATLIELARSRGIVLPSYTEEGLRETVFKDRYASLSEYLKGFQYTTAVLQDPEALEQAAYELAVDNQLEGVRYIEPRFAPQLHINDKQDVKTVLWAVHRGLKRAKDEFNTRPGVRTGDEPPFEYGVITCAMRMFGDGFSNYYDAFLRVHRYAPRKRVFAMASLELAQAVIALRDEYGIPIVGFDLAGQENGYPAEDHIEAYQYAHKNFLKKTVHAGEAYGPESIFQAITDLYADRVGHGYHLLSAWLIDNSAIHDKNSYIRRLAEYIADRRITIEVCLTSNLQTNPMLRTLSEHAFRDMRKLRISTTICTDNRTVSNTTVSKEIELAVSNFNLSPNDLKHILIYGFKRSFFPGTYLEKRRYVRQVIDYYLRLEREAGMGGGDHETTGEATLVDLDAGTGLGSHLDT
jgi:adenosine deaminase